MRYSFAGIFFACLITFTVSAQKNKLTTLSGKLADKGAFTMIYLDTLSQKTSEDFAAAAVEADGAAEGAAVVYPDGPQVGRGETRDVAVGPDPHLGEGAGGQGCGPPHDGVRGRVAG